MDNRQGTIKKWPALKPCLCKVVIFSLFIFHFSLLRAQDTAIHVYQDTNVHNLVQKKMEYARITQGVFAGYRIQISFGQDRDEASKVMSSFIAKYHDMRAYFTYQQPYFKVNVGDFRTRLEAVKKLNRIRRDYPGAFVVMDKINPPAVKKHTTAAK